MNQLHEELARPIAAVASRDTTRQRRRDWQRGSLAAGGVAFAIGNLLHPLEHNDAAYTKPTWEAAHLTIFFSIPLLVLGLPVLYRRLQAERPRSPLNTFGVAASVVGLIGIAPGTILEAFVAPTIGYDAMTDLESGGMAIVNAAMGIAYLACTPDHFPDVLAAALEGRPIPVAPA